MLAWKVHAHIVAAINAYQLILNVVCLFEDLQSLGTENKRLHARVCELEDIISKNRNVCTNL